MSITIGAMPNYGGGFNLDLGGLVSPQTLKALRTIYLSRGATRAELAAARALVVRSAVRGALRNTPWGRVLELASVAWDSGLGDEVKGAAQDFWQAFFPDTNWISRGGPYAATIANAFAAGGIHDKWYSAPPYSTIQPRVSTPNGLYQVIGGVIYANFHWLAPFDATYWRIQNRVSFRWSGSGSLYLPTLDSAGNAVAPRTLYPSYAIPSVSPAVPWHMVGQYNRWRELVMPRQDGKPIRENGTVTVVKPPAQVLPAVQISAAGRVTTGDPHTFSKPGKGEKERKGKVTRNQALVLSALKRVNDATEALDAMDAAYYALPEHLRKRGANGTDKLKALYRHINEVDMNTFVWNLIKAQAMDTFAARTSGGKALRKLYRHQPSHMPTFGGGALVTGDQF